LGDWQEVAADAKFIVLNVPMNLLLGKFQRVL